MEQDQPRLASVTVADVARAAGVSKATAARVLGGYGTVSDRARAAVTAAAKALDYRPNELARSMTTGRSGTIGVVVGDIENPFFSLAVRGIADVARLAGFNVILTNSGEESGFEKAAVKTLTARRVDGLIVSPAHDGDIEHLRDVARSGRPLVLLDRAVSSLGVDAVTADDAAAGERAARLLIDEGHRRIVYLTACDPGPQGFTALGDLYTGSVRERVSGFLRAGAEAGIADMAALVRPGANTPERVRRIVLDLLALSEPPTAIIASDSVIGLEVFRLARELGLDLPGGLSLVSFHDADWTSVTSPPVTVIRQPVYDMGATAARRLVERLKGETGPARHAVLETALVERGSVGPAPAQTRPPLRRPA